MVTSSRGIAVLLSIGTAVLLSIGTAVLLSIGLVAGVGTARAGDDLRTHQVQIETRIVETSLDFARELGVRFRAFDEDGAATSGRSTPSGVPWIATLPRFAPFVLADDTPPSRGGKLTTGEGEPARIPVEPDAGSELTLTPLLLDDGRLQLDLQVGLPVGGASGAAGPPPELRRVRTTVTLPDGGSLAIGGLGDVASERDAGRLPVLGRIPLLGRLFGSDEGTAQETHLMVFITPTLIQEDGSSGRPRWSSPPGRPDGTSRERVYRPQPDSQ